jgi:hypothetical protein
MYEIIEELCSVCHGSQKNSTNSPCWNCSGDGIIKRDIMPLENQFTEGHLKYCIHQFQCNVCEKEWHLSDTSQAQSGDYQRELYQCTCGAIITLSTNWVTEYSIKAKLFKGI